MSESKQNNGQQSWVGIAVIVVGALLLLQSLGIGNFGRFMAQWWPLIIVGVGFVKMRADDRRGGLIILIVGLVLLSATLNFINWGVIFRFWPVVIILVGLSLYLQSTGRPGLSLVNREESGDDYVNLTAFFGGMNRVVNSKDFKGANVFCMFGGVELDLRNAGVEGDTVTINVTSLFGGAEIMVPQGWAVDLRGTPLFGGIEDKTSGAADGSVTVIIKSMTAFGGLELRN